MSFAPLNPDPDRVNTASRNLEEEEKKKKKNVKKINAAISSCISSCLYIHHARANHITNYLFSFIHLLFTLQFSFLFLFYIHLFFLDFDFLYLKLYHIKVNKKNYSSQGLHTTTYMDDIVRLNIFIQI